MDATLLKGYQEIQTAAKETVAYIRRILRPGMTLEEVRTLAEEKLLLLGADSFWYHGVGAFVFAGDQTALSMSGRSYRTPQYVLGPNDILTMDLSPQKNGLWGDYARTLLMEDGRAMENPKQARNTEWARGMRMEEALHEAMRRFVTPDTTFEALYEHINAMISAHGFVNLDFLGNLGHSIERNPDDRVYIEQGNTRRLGEGRLFTFEPHISLPGSKYGYKMENIYFFDGDVLKEL